MEMQFKDGWVLCSVNIRSEPSDIEDVGPMSRRSASDFLDGLEIKGAALRGVTVSEAAGGRLVTIEVDA